MLFVAVGIGFQVLKDGAELRKGITQKVGVLEEVAAFLAFEREPADGEYQGDDPELRANECEAIQEQEGYSER